MGFRRIKESIDKRIDKMVTKAGERVVEIILVGIAVSFLPYIAKVISIPDFPVLVITLVLSVYLFGMIIVGFKWREFIEVFLMITGFSFSMGALYLILKGLKLLSEFGHLDFEHGISFEHIQQVGDFYSGTVGPLLTFATVSFIGASFYRNKNIKIEEDRKHRDQIEREASRIQFNRWEDSFYKTVDNITKMLDEDDERSYQILKEIGPPNITNLYKDVYFLIYDDLMFKEMAREINVEKQGSKELFDSVKTMIDKLLNSYNSLIYMLNQCPEKKNEERFFTYLLYLSSKFNTTRTSTVTRIHAHGEILDRYPAIKKIHEKYYPLDEAMLLIIENQKRNRYELITGKKYPVVKDTHKPEEQD